MSDATRAGDALSRHNVWLAVGEAVIAVIRVCDISLAAGQEDEGPHSSRRPLHNSSPPEWDLRRALALPVGRPAFSESASDSAAAEVPLIYVPPERGSRPKGHRHRGSVHSQPQTPASGTRRHGQDHGRAPGGGGPATGASPSLSVPAILMQVCRGGG